MPTISFNQLENPSKNLGPNLGPTERLNCGLTYFDSPSRLASNTSRSQFLGPAANGIPRFLMRCC